MSLIGKYTCCIVGALCCALVASTAHADESQASPPADCTPQAVFDALHLGKAIKQGGYICSSDVIADGSFEAALASTPWTSFSRLNGSPICDPACAGVSKPAWSGDGFVFFTNGPSIEETGFVSQIVTLPDADFAYITFYLKGSGSGSDLDFTLSIDGESLLNFTVAFTSAYTEYIPLAYDLTPYLDGGDHEIKFSVRMDPGNPTQVFLDDVCIEIVDFDGGAGDICADLCAEPGTDTDGDGVNDVCEACLGTDPTRADTDGDGIDDRFERDRGLNPTNPADALLDPDGDGLNNFEEFTLDSNPFDRDDPTTVRFVSPNGVDIPGGGTSDAPWATIVYALNNTPATPEKRANITLLAGYYPEDFTLKPNVVIRALAPLSAAIQGNIFAADNAELNGLRLVPNAAGETSLYMDNESMVVRGCFFDGRIILGGTGVRVEGDASGSRFIGCTFEGLDICFDVYGSMPGLRTSRVALWNEAGIWIRDVDDDDKSGGIGDVTSAEVGYNQFVEGNQGPAVLYEREQTFVCELNWWGTVDPDEIPNVIQGNADFVPFLASAAILPASVVCTIINAADQSRVTDASVSLSPGLLSPVTANTNGVYNFGAVSDGVYDLRAVSETLGEATARVAVGSGEVASAVLVLGESTDPNPDPGCGCGGQKAGNGPGAADLLVAATALLSMLVAAKAHRP